jgi:7-carboxy-7-deazaguanine synthase
LDEIVSTVKRSKTILVEVTGGEPLLQKDTPELCRHLLDAGLDVLVETNGAEDISRLPAGVRRIMDCKCPSSGMAERTLASNFDALGPLDEVKFAILDHRDYRYALSIISEYGLDGKAGDISFSPVALFGGKGCDPAELAEWMLRDDVPAALRPQLHKIIWPRGEPRTL